MGIEERLRGLSENEQRALLLSMKRKRYATSLYDLCREVLDYEDVGLVHQEMEVVLREKKFKLFLIPRGHLKSSFLTIGYTIQYLINHPNNRVLITNATWDNSRKFLKEIQGKIESEKFRAIFGDWKTEHWNMDECTIAAREFVQKEPSISTTGVEKNITGQHYDLIINDDLVNKENVSTPDQTRKVIEYYESLLPILEPDGDMICVGTRWHKLDLYGHIINKLSDQFIIYKRGVFENGKYIFPEKFNDEVLAKFKANMRPSLFASQYLNEPISEENQPIKTDYFRYYSKAPSNITLINTAVDLARSDNFDSDETAIVTVGWTPNSEMYVLDVQHGRWGTEEKIEKIYEVYKKWKPRNMGIEKDAQQKYFLDILTLYEFRGYERLPVFELKSGNKNKEDRIMNLEPLFRASKVFFPEFAGFRTYLESQLMSFTPQGTHGNDDVIDALASHLQMYTPQDLDIKSLSWAEKNKDKEKDLNFIQNAVLWDTEEYLKRQKKSSPSFEDFLWLDEIEGF